MLMQCTNKYVHDKLTTKSGTTRSNYVRCQPIHSDVRKYCALALWALIIYNAWVEVRFLLCPIHRHLLVFERFHSSDFLQFE